jgi:hypothetical protein
MLSDVMKSLYDIADGEDQQDELYCNSEYPASVSSKHNYRNSSYHVFSIPVGLECHPYSSNLFTYVIANSLVAGKQASIIFTTLRKQLFTSLFIRVGQRLFSKTQFLEVLLTQTYQSTIMALSTTNPEHLHGLVDMGR